MIGILMDYIIYIIEFFIMTLFGILFQNMM